jgi:hypothetical protein
MGTRKPKARVLSLVDGEIDVAKYDPMVELLKFRNLLVEELNALLNGGFEDTGPISGVYEDSKAPAEYRRTDHSAKIVAEIQAIDKELMPYKHPKLRSQETKVEAGDSITDLLRELNGR